MWLLSATLKLTKAPLVIKNWIKLNKDVRSTTTCLPKFNLLSPLFANCNRKTIEKNHMNLMHTCEHAMSFWLRCPFFLCDKIVGALWSVVANDLQITQQNDKTSAQSPIILFGASLVELLLLIWAPTTVLKTEVNCKKHQCYKARDTELVYQKIKRQD
jgi:hypothetical protein